jgi:multidomain signaling protein FimX
VLVRIIGDGDERVPAGQFMPYAEQAQQSIPIDRWVVRRAILALADLHQHERKATFFINLSASALHDVEMVIMIQRWLTETGLKGKYIVLELEESAMAANPGPTVAFLRAAKRVGCRVCIDNFGHQVDAIAKLEELPVEYVKIDGSLVKDASDDAGSLQELKRVVDASKRVSNTTIAKSVESAAALSVLWTLGLDYAQGHYFQTADTRTDYQFVTEDETATLSSETHAPHWARS